MRKKIFSFLLALCLIIPAIAGIVGCGSPSALVFFRLNDLGATTRAKLTDAFWEKEGIKEHSENSSFGVMTAAEFDAMNSHAPKENEIEAPTFEEKGKMAFGGWYFDSECTAGMQFNKENWDREYKKEQEQDSDPDLYAKWIEDDEILVTFTVGNENLDFTQEYRNKNNSFTHKNPRFIFKSANLATEFAKLPTKADIKNQTAYDVQGWFLTPDFKTGTELTQENLEKEIQTGKHFFEAYLKTTEYTKMYIQYSVIRDNGESMNFKSNIEYSSKNLYAQSEGEFPQSLIYDIIHTTTFQDAMDNCPKLSDIHQIPGYEYKILGYYIDREFKEPFDETEFNKQKEKLLGYSDKNNRYPIAVVLKVSMELINKA